MTLPDLNPNKALQFTPGSRYHGIETLQLEIDGGQSVVYLKRRFLPRPERFITMGEHTVGDHDRLDTIAHLHLNDPEQFWRIADANVAMNPFDLTREEGTTLRITMPEGIPGLPGQG
jgi:hypothetical protein